MYQRFLKLLSLLSCGSVEFDFTQSQVTLWSHEDTSVSTLEVTLNGLSARVDTWADWVQPNVGVVTYGNLVVWESFRAAITSVEDNSVRELDLLAEISQPPRVLLVFSATQRVIIPVPVAISSVINGILSLTSVSIGVWTLGSTDGIELWAWRELVGLDFTEGQHFVFTWDHDAQVSTNKIARNGLVPWEKTWTCWIGKDIGVVSNVDLVIGESLTTAVLSVLDNDGSDGLRGAHISLPPRIVFEVSAAERVWIGPHARWVSIYCAEGLCVVTGSVGGALFSCGTFEDVDLRLLWLDSHS